MGFTVIHMEKYKANDIKGIQSHNNRERKSKSNQDIDYEKSLYNYHLLKCDNYKNKIVDTIYKNASESKTIRKDAVVLCSFIITSDNNTMTKMSPEVERNFFEKSFEFISERYGKENVVSATVHKDEKTPHMHITIVPVKDKRLCAKKLFDRKELSNLQTDFAEKIGSQFEMQRGKEGSEQKHLSEIRFKIKKEKEQLEILKEDLNLMKNRVGTLQHRFEEIEHKITEQKKELAELTTKAQSKMNDFNAITKDYNERSTIIKNNYEKANVVLDKQADEIKNRTEKINEQDVAIKYRKERLSFLEKNVEAHLDAVKKNSEIIKNQAIEINKGEHAIKSMRELEKSIREDLERTVSDFNAKDKQVLNRAVEFIKTLPNEIQERWLKFNIERKRTPSAWAKKLANEKKNGLER